MFPSSTLRVLPVLIYPRNYNIMTYMAKVLIIIGIALIISGLCLHMFGKIPGIGRLPGDILIKKENFTLYIPITTCLLISLILSLLFYLWNQK